MPGAKGAAANRQSADTFASCVLPVIRSLQASGVTTMLAITGGYARGIATARGGARYTVTVSNMLAQAV